MLGTSKEERRIQKAHIALMRNPKFILYSGIMMIGSIDVVNDPSITARTNGRDVIYGREFVKTLNDKELAFLVLHENMHKAYQHMSVWRKLHDENSVLANVACDYVINIQLYDYDPTAEFIQMPKDGCIDDIYRGMNSKEVFEALKKRGGGRGGGTGGEGKGGKGFDQHDWDGAKNLSDEERKALERDIDAGLRQGIAAAKMVGDGAGGMSRELQDALEPSVDWREVLREFVKATCRNKDKSSWRKVNRRFLGDDIYMPSLIGESVGRIVVAIDTSGSIGGDDLAKFMGEVQSIAEDVAPEMIDLLYWDSQIAAHEEYTRDDLANMLATTKPKGGGGTAPSCITKWLAANSVVPECSVVLTDGYVGSDWGGEWPSPVLWCVVGGNNAIAATGKTIHVK